MLMLNQKKILMAVAVAVLGLSSCGRDNYNGTYTGYQTASAVTTTGTPQTGYPQTGYYSQNGSGTVTASLSNNGDVVTGTYQVQPSGYTSMGMGSQSYQVQANSAQSSQLSNVVLIPTTSMYSAAQCGAFTGSLSSSNHGQILSGTLTPGGMPGMSGAQNSMCPPVTVSLTRNN